MRGPGREEVWWASSQTDDEVLMPGWREGGTERVRVVFSSLVMLLCLLVWIFNETAFKYYWLLEGRLLLSKCAPSQPSLSWKESTSPSLVFGLGYVTDSGQWDISEHEICWRSWAGPLCPCLSLRVMK